MKYRAITSENFYFLELKKACKYILKNEIIDRKKEFYDEDVLNTKSISNFNKKYLSINRRIINLNDFLMEEITISDNQTGKFLNLYSILCAERLIFEFMNEVIFYNVSCYNYFVEEKEFYNFIIEKSNQSDTIANWSDGGRKKMSVKLKNFLFEGGFLIKTENGYKIIRPVILPEIINEIKESGNREVLKAMLY